MKRITLIGPYPPPMGGISVHLKRTQAYLKTQGIECRIYNEIGHGNREEEVYPIKKYKLFIFKIPFLKGEVLHFHTIDKRIRMLLFIYKFIGKKVILTIHGQSLMDQLRTSNSLSKFILINSLKSINKIICVNELNTNQLISLGFKKDRLITLPAYIHPIESSSDYEKLPKKVRMFLDTEGFIISANGCIRFYNEQDLYGLDLLIGLIKKLSTANINVKLIFAVLDVQGQNAEEREYFEILKNRINELGLENQILLYEVEDTEFYPIVKRSNLFIRPTNVDGFGVSIAEALYYGVPSIASDVCKRPDGTIIFKNRSHNDLYEKVILVIGNYKYYKERIENISYEDNAKKLRDTYNSCS